MLTEVRASLVPGIKLEKLQRVVKKQPVLLFIGLEQWPAMICSLAAFYVLFLSVTLSTIPSNS